MSADNADDRCVSDFTFSECCQQEGRYPSLYSSHKKHLLDGLVAPCRADCSIACDTAWCGTAYEACTDDTFNVTTRIHTFELSIDELVRSLRPNLHLAAIGMDPWLVSLLLDRLAADSHACISNLTASSGVLRNLTLSPVPS